LAAVARDAVATQISLSQIAKGRGGFGIEGIGGGDGAGYAVASAGDVNGDGLDDLIIGAPAADPDGHLNGGQVFVVFGRTDTSKVRLEDVAAGVGGFVLNGMRDFAYAGVSVASAGDVNGDGLADVIVLAQAPCCSQQTGTAYVVFGKTSTTPVDLDSSLSSKKQGFVISGMTGMEYVGQVAGVGDVNGDGTDDVIWRNNATGAWGWTDVANRSAWHDLGASSTAYNVVGVADFNGDGKADTLWENPTTGDIGYSAGAATGGQKFVPLATAPPNFIAKT
jgi:hypothetical protein